jgi:radical SAM superfamily enzyme YgiQ (UPF0313 family)
MKVLLVYPRAGAEIIGAGDLGAIAEPLALEYLAAGARQAGHEVRLHDLRLRPDGLDGVLEEFRPHVVGLTGYSMHVLRNLATCRRVKELLPECRTVVGGHHATLLPEDFFEPEVDHVVRGEGVWPFVEILRNLERGSPATSVAGVWSNSDGVFRSGGDPVPFDLDSIPPPDRSVTAGDRASYFIDWMSPIALLRSTVGCPYRCSFCSLWRIMDGKYHIRGVARVVAELASVPEECVFLVDDEAFINRKHMLELAQAVHDAGLRKRYFTYCRIDTFLREKELLTAWRRIGLERLFIGIEAVSVKGLADYNKRLTVAQIEEGLAAARDLGIAVFAGFIVNTSFTRRDFQVLARFIEHQKIDYPSFTVLTPLPGTDALRSFDDVVERQPNGRPNWELFDLQHPVTRTTLPKQEFLREYEQLQRDFGGRSLAYREGLLTHQRRERLERLQAGGGTPPPSWG